LKKFYIRRVLRILPVYLFAIVIAATLLKSVKHDFIFHLLFIQNFSALWAPFMPAYGYATHLWSLAVEEQFYLLWAPVVLFLIGYKKMTKICLLAILISIIFKIWCSANHSYDAIDYIPRWTILWTLRLHTVGNIDSLAIGCLIAIDCRYRLVSWDSGFAYQFKKVATFLVLPIFVVLIGYTEILGFRAARATSIYMVLHDLFMQIPFWLLLHHTVHGRGVPLFENRLLVWIGKKSYGMYIWHEFIKHGAIILCAQLFNYQLAPQYSMLSFVVFISGIFIAAIVSWNFIEAPFLRLKTKWA